MNEQTTCRRTAILLLTSLLAAALPGNAKEDPMKNAPGAVQQVTEVYMDQRVPGGRVVSLEVVEWNGEPAYTVDMVSGEGEHLSLTLTPPGKILQDVIRVNEPGPGEEMIWSHEAPKGVRQVVERMRNDGRLESVIATGKELNGDPIYRVNILMKDGKKVVLRITRLGKLLQNPEGEQADENGVPGCRVRGRSESVKA